MHRGIFVAPFDELSDPRLVADLAREAEKAGWDGFFVWDHIRYSAPVEAVSDPWIVLAAIATATERVRSARWSRRWPAGAFTSWRARPSRSTT